MTWTFKRSLFRTHVAGLLSLALLFTLFLFFSHQDWLPGRNGPRENPLAYTIRGFRSPKVDTNQNSSLRSLLKDANAAAKPLLNLSSQQADNTGGNSGRVMGLGDAMSANNSLQKEMDVTGKLSAQPYRYILNEPLKCKDSTPFLVLLIAAEPGQKDARNAIRQTIAEESRTYHDIIQQDYQDTYYNLTIKTLMGMNWVATHCPQVSYVMKTDSDMFVNTEYLIQKLLKPELPPKQRNWLRVFWRFGGADLPGVAQHSQAAFGGRLRGICLAKLRIDPQPPPNEFLFNHWRVSYSSCKYSHLITSHQFQPGELVKYWSHLQTNKHNACVNAAKEKNGRYRHRRFHGERPP
ncbi:hypothetical protein WMY93_024420 [Mugilogobius chulae]|uniref:Hexosyltransferase n=1 Tax=Mugilogobius chulae TaxID=88201 RepID=A0AAW0N9Y0_9GOBI